jgi:hypothetical protein
MPGVELAEYRELGHRDSLSGRLLYMNLVMALSKIIGGFLGAWLAMLVLWYVYQRKTKPFKPRVATGGAVVLLVAIGVFRLLQWVISILLGRLSIHALHVVAGGAVLVLGFAAFEFRYSSEILAFNLQGETHLRSTVS